MRLRYERRPHPHLVVEEIVEPARYAAMRFPDELIEPGASWGLTPTDDGYAAVLADPRWGRLIAELRSEQFVRRVVDAFADDLVAAGSLIDTSSVRLIDFDETRAQKESPVLEVDGDPNELFTRLDFQSKGHGGYREFVHLDWARRVIGGILFFSDADEEGLEGGELAFFRDRGFRDDRWCHDPELIATFRPVHNTGVLFLNSNGGFHGPRAITQLRGRRRWLYYAISSKVDVWPCVARSS